MVPLPALQFPVEVERSANTVTVLRKKIDMLCVLSICKLVSAATSAEKFFCSRINCCPLKAGARKYLKGLACSCAVDRNNFAIAQLRVICHTPLSGAEPSSIFLYAIFLLLTSILNSSPVTQKL